MGARVRQLGALDEASVERAFPADAAERRWLGSAPAGARRWAAWQGSEPRGWCSAPSRVAWMAGREVLFTELTDPCMPCTADGAEDLAAEADWSAAASATLGEREDFVQYALPSEAAWLRGVRFSGFDIVRPQHVLVDERVSPCEPPPLVEELAGFDHQIRWLWDRCAGGFGASVVRDAELYRWRFGARAGRRYRSFGLRDGSGVLRGFAAYTSGAWLARRSGVLVEWLVPPEEEETGAALLQAVRARAHADGVTSVMTTLVEWSPWFERFQRAGFAVHPSPLFLVARCAARRFDQLWLRDHWWLTLADTCLV